MSTAVPDCASPHRPSVAEATLGWVYGEGAALEGTESTAQTPRQALEQHLLGLLGTAPCFVAFSGGRDSSLLLAVAVHVARRSSLPTPVPVTLRYPSLPETDERQWQELLLRRLRIPDWIVVDVDRENSLTGPNAAVVLRRHGPYFPVAAHTSTPVARAASGGVVLTGEGGDMVLSPHRAWATMNLLHGRGIRHVAAWRVAARGAAPSRIRARHAGREAVDARPWLSAAGAALAGQRAAEAAAREPFRWPQAIRRVPRLNALTTGLATLDRIYSAAGTRVVHPLLAADFVAALAARFGALGPASRSRVVADLAGDLLPGELTTRSDKVSFTRALVCDDVRDLVRDWDGNRGIDPTLVDPERLREEWLRDCPSALSLQLLLNVVHATRHPGTAA